AAPVAVQDAHSGVDQPPGRQVLAVASERSPAPRGPNGLRPFLRPALRPALRPVMRGARGIPGPVAGLRGVHSVPPPAPTVTPPRDHCGSWWITGRLWITPSPAGGTG